MLIEKKIHQHTKKKYLNGKFHENKNNFTKKIFIEENIIENKFY